MADSQVPWGVNCLAGVISEPAWRSKRSWYLVTTEDKMIPPPLQRQMATRANATVSETKGSPCDLCVTAASRDQVERAGRQGERLI